MPLLFKDFVRELRTYDGLAKKVEVADLQKMVNRVECSVKPAEDILRSLKAEKSQFGYFTLNEEPVGKIRSILNAGELDELAKVSKSAIHITSADRSAFKELVAANPVKSFSELTKETRSIKKLHPDLDTTADGMSSLSKTAKSKLSKITKNLFNYAKKGTKIAMMIGVVYVGVDWLAKATVARRGCFMLTTIDNVTTSCKVRRFTCVPTDDAAENGWCGDDSVYGHMYNVTLYIMHLVMLPDTDALKKDFADTLRVDIKDLKNITLIMSQFYDAASIFVRDLKNRPTIDVCGLKHPDIENGVVPPCRMCNPSANPTSTEYVDSSQYGDNMTFQCNVNPSILDTITDLGKHVTTNLWNGVSNSFFSFLKPLAYAIVIICVLVAAVGLIFKSLRKPPPDVVSTVTSNTPYVLMS